MRMYSIEGTKLQSQLMDPSRYIYLNSPFHRYFDPGSVHNRLQRSNNFAPPQVENWVSGVGGASLFDPLTAI